MSFFGINFGKSKNKKLEDQSQQQDARIGPSFEIYKQVYLGPFGSDLVKVKLERKTILPFDSETLEKIIRSDGFKPNVVSLDGTVLSEQEQLEILRRNTNDA